MRRKRTLAGMLPRLHLLYASRTIPRVYWHIHSFQRVSREARPEHDSEHMPAVWASPHEEQCSDGVVAPHGFALLVCPELGAVRDPFPSGVQTGHPRPPARPAAWRRAGPALGQVRPAARREKAV